MRADLSHPAIEILMTQVTWGCTISRRDALCVQSSPGGIENGDIQQLCEKEQKTRRTAMTMA